MLAAMQTPVIHLTKTGQTYNVNSVVPQQSSYKNAVWGSSSYSFNQKI